ncbi:MAG: NYN domain-containing protein [Leptospiraceae bacterium]|nr:NYN domain-containing protein [Leptospiraceae bacterium]
MQLLIDGFNLIYKFPDLEAMMYDDRLNDARKGLLLILLEYSKKKKGDKFSIFFDGKKEKGSVVREDMFGEMKLYYSGDLTADYEIKRYVTFSPNPGNLFVVTSDKDIIGHCKKFKAKTITSEEFSKSIIQELEPSQTIEVKPEHQTAEELEFWKKVFQEKKNAKSQN